MEPMSQFEKYPTYQELEEAKEEGWREIRNTDEPYKKAWYFLNRIIWAHYWRAREDIEAKRNRRTLLRKIRGKNYYSGYILDIDHYTRHWLHAMREQVSQETLDSIRNDFFYEPEENKYLRNGYTMYYFSEK